MSVVHARRVLPLGDLSGLGASISGRSAGGQPVHRQHGALLRLLPDVAAPSLRHRHRRQCHRRLLLPVTRSRAAKSYVAQRTAAPGSTSRTGGSSGARSGPGAGAGAAEQPRNVRHRQHHGEGHDEFDEDRDVVPTLSIPARISRHQTLRARTRRQPSGRQICRMVFAESIGGLHRDSAPAKTLAAHRRGGQ
jgi:hypothetical protein